MQKTKIPYAFFKLAIAYLLTGITIGLLGSFQYLLPDFLKQKLSFQQARPLHVYLVTAWIFCAAQGAIYYYVQHIKQTALKFSFIAKLHWVLQLITSLLVIVSFLTGNFSGREYLEFPPWIGFLIIFSWVLFGINILSTLKPSYSNAPVYFFSWTLGITFFIITFSESYLWKFDFFNDNPIRDITVQWKAMGAMVGSWNMLVFGAALCSMELMKNDKRISRNSLAFAFFFIGFANLLFNWGHHTYIVPAKPWVRQTAFIISMTELILLANIILKWKKSMRNNLSMAQKNSGRLLFFADNWIFINLFIALGLSVPALNYYTHGTHITVAHAMGTTIGINTFILFSIIFHIVEGSNKSAIRFYRSSQLFIKFTNACLVIFFVALNSAGVIKIIGNIQQKPFSAIMQDSKIPFMIFAASGAGLLAGLTAISIILLLKMKIDKAEKGMIADEIMLKKLFENAESLKAPL